VYLRCASCGEEKLLTQELFAAVPTSEDGSHRCPACGAQAATISQERGSRKGGFGARRRVSAAEPEPPAGLEFQDAFIPPPPLADLSQSGQLGEWGSSEIRLRRQGRTYRVRDLDQLRSWIVEGRVMGADLVSMDGVRWQPVEHVPTMGRLVRVAQRLDRPQRQRRGIKEASAPAEGWGEAPANDERQPAATACREDPQTDGSA